MMNNDEIKEMVRQKYAEIATQDKTVNMSSCCGAGGCSTEVYNIMSESYEHLEGYVPEADLGLGCGIPTEFAAIKAGDTVVDLGSGAGNDCFIARRETGAEGKVIGIDFTEAMIAKARENAEKLGYNNVEFRQGDIENMPLGGNKADVVISNCVLNLVPNKAKAFSEIHRVLKPGGHFTVSDIVLQAALPEKMKTVAELYAGCVSGAIPMEEYLQVIRAAGFENVEVLKNKPIIIPDDILSQYLDSDGIAVFSGNPESIVSITVRAVKPVNGACCAPGQC
jgi:ubiquinone/menaquinone biosynthesis C-methylase UbiE